MQITRDNLIIAIVGVSHIKQKYGYVIFKNLRDKGYVVYGINPKYESIDHIRIYPSLEKLPKKPHVVVFVVKPEISYRILKEVSRSIRDAFFWFQPGAESKESIDYCLKNNLKCIFNHCIMRETDKGILKIKDGRLEIEESD